MNETNLNLLSSYNIIAPLKLNAVAPSLKSYIYCIGILFSKSKLRILVIYLDVDAVEGL